MRNLLFIIMTVFATSGFSQSKNFIDQNYIEVTGKAEMEVLPNEIYLKIFLNEKEFKVKRSIEAVEKLMLKRMKDIGIDVNKDIAVQDIASNFRNYWILASTINKTKEYRLKVSDAKTAGLVFKEMESIGISNISIEELKNSEIEKFRREVKINAIKAAKEKAEALASAIGQKVGKAIHVREITMSVFKERHDDTASLSNISIRGLNNEKKDEALIEPNIEFKKIMLEYAIMAKFELEH